LVEGIPSSSGPPHVDDPLVPADTLDELRVLDAIHAKVLVPVAFDAEARIIIVIALPKLDSSFSRTFSTAAEVSTYATPLRSSTVPSARDDSTTSGMRPISCVAHDRHGSCARMPSSMRRNTSSGNDPS